MIIRASEDPTGWYQDSREGSRNGGSGGAVAFVLVVLVLVVAFFLILPNISGGGLGFFSSILNPSRGTSSGSTSTSTLTLYSPLIQNGSADIAYPSDYGALSQYALGLINSDRATASLAPVQLSQSPAGQQHSDSMLRYGYFSHWDTQGYKPYMRYSLLGGRSGVGENIAYASYFPGRFSNSQAVEAAIAMLESSMMYNDSACCNNGHRDNILNPLHTRVSIGIAYNYTILYFAEEFENYYLNVNFSLDSHYVVSMSGTVASSVNPQEVLVAFDPSPSALTTHQLNTGPNHYDPGAIVGGVLTPCTFGCPTFNQGTTAYATTWQFGPSRFDLVFPLADFVNANGAGVYTLYLLQGMDTGTAITSISVFVHG